VKLVQTKKKKKRRQRNQAGGGGEKGQLKGKPPNSPPRKHDGKTKPPTDSGRKK